MRPALVVDVGLKLALVAALAFGTLSDLERFEGKAFGARLIAYPLATLVVPAAWWFGSRRPPYPYAADILFTLPFLIDTLGNVFDLYDTIEWWDDANHFVNWALLTAAFGQFLLAAAARCAEHVRARVSASARSPRSSGSSASTSPSSATRPSWPRPTRTPWATSRSG